LFFGKSRRGAALAGSGSIARGSVVGSAATTSCPRLAERSGPARAGAGIRGLRRSLGARFLARLVGDHGRARSGACDRPASRRLALVPRTKRRGEALALASHGACRLQRGAIDIVDTPFCLRRAQAFRGGIAAGSSAPPRRRPFAPLCGTGSPV